MRRAVIAAVLWALFGAASTADDLYSDALLQDVSRRVGGNITAMIEQDIVRTVPRPDRPRAARIDTRMILRGRHPLDFYADPRAGKIYVPMESVRFFDDLAILQSWFVAKGCDPAPIQTYLWALLRQGRALPPPLKAFGIDRDTALADPFTDDVSGKVLKSGLFFILSHEVGHILLAHQGGTTGPFSQDQERAADAFALDRFAQIGTYPGGAALYFIAARWLDPTGAAVAQGSHPVAPDRIAAIAERLAADPAAFSFGEPDRALGAAQVRYVAGELATLARLSSDEAMLTLLPLGLERRFPLSRLRSACPG